MNNFRKTFGDSTVVFAKTFTIMGCLLFLFSFVLPFYYARWTALLSSLTWSDNYWSYMAIEHLLYGALERPLSGSQVFWFYQYWIGSYEFTFDIQSVLIPMFGVQLLTLVLGLLSIRFSRRTLLSAPVLVSSLAAALTTYAGEKISTDVEVLSGGYQLGYYLVYPAIGMFLLVFLVNEVTKKGSPARAE